MTVGATLVHAAQRGNFFTERLLHPNTYECKKIEEFGG